MQTKDHKMLAEYLISEIGQDVPGIYRRAFILGSIEPDRNPFTYLHGLVRGKKFHGHNYENILPVIEKLFRSLRSKRRWGVREYYRFGKLLHYAADAFTFPHNRTFTGNLKEHCRYEKELHQRFISMLRKPRKYLVHLVQNSKRSSFPEYIKSLHEEYLQRARSCENDCSYIALIARCGMIELLPGRWEPCGFPPAMDYGRIYGKENGKAENLYIQCADGHRDAGHFSEHQFVCDPVLFRIHRDGIQSVDEDGYGCGRAGWSAGGLDGSP